MTLHQTQRPLLVLAVVLLIGLATASSPVVGISAAPDQVRTFSWTFVTSRFYQDQGGYLSPVGRAPFPFTAAGVHLKPVVFTSEFPAVELRLKAEGGDWSRWYPIDGLELQADGRLYSENLIAWPEAREVQVRVRASSPLHATIRDLTVIAIDASAGPTAAQAARSAEVRTASMAGVARDGSGIPQPVVIRRAEWGADEGWMTWPPEYAPVDKMILHHTVSGGGGDPAAEVRAIYYYHAVTRGWGDMGYNFLVDRFGNIYEGRSGGTDVVGAHVSHWNQGSLGVAVLGCYDNDACSPPQVPTWSTLTTLVDLVAWTSSRRAIDPRALRRFSNGESSVTTYVLSGHSDYESTVCPGGNLYAELPNLRQVAWERLPEYDVRFGWHNTPSSLEVGQRVTVYPNLYNYGRLLWSDAGGVRLGYRWIQDGRVVVENTAAARIIPSAVIEFGEMTALVAQLTAPTNAGTFTLRWDLYRDGVGWFAAQPAPAGRSQPLDLVVEVHPRLALDVQLRPPSVDAGASLRVEIALQGRVGQDFQARTRLPPRVKYVVDSGRSDTGSLYPESDSMVWTGTLRATTAQASFDILVSSELDTPLALATITTLNAAGHSPVVVTRRFIVNGRHVYLPLVGAVRAD